jgi:2-polyprenyl-6-methoxyphenol hydroxylase-like FAD-dependent oxidoreductase
MLERAVVVGGSFGGMAAAAALASRADEVVVVERRSLPASGEVASVAAQGTMPHILLGGGAESMEQLLPGFVADLAARGAVVPTGEVRCHWWAGGAVRQTFPDLGMPIPMCTRALVESTLRDRVRAMPNVSFRDGTGVRGLKIVGRRVRGLRLTGPGEDATLESDLVVDATGRSARSAEWLTAAGWQAPATSEVLIRLTYTAVFVRRVWTPDLPLFAMSQNSPEVSRIGVALQGEDDKLQIVVGGYFGEAAPTDRAGLVAFARTLADPVIAELLEHEWLTEPARYQFRSSLRHHWERTELPAGLCVVGDTVASFNPIYGQGMTSAAQQAVELGRQVDRHGASPTLPRAVAKAQARVVANPWRTATGSDFAYADTVGKRAPGTDFVNRYLEQVFQAAATDPVVALQLARVQQMLAAPPMLFRPDVVARVRRARRRTPVGAVPVPA